MALLGLAVLIICCAISLGVFAAARASELQAASWSFQTQADDLASRVFDENWAHLRDVRLVAERVGINIESTGALSVRKSYARFSEPLRNNPNRIFTGEFDKYGCRLATPAWRGQGFS
jgi:hypothetical protein